MQVHSACPYCHNECVWSDTSETKYVRCAHCTKSFVISTWGIGQPVTPRRHRRREQGRLLWPWMLGFTIAVIVVGVGLAVMSLRREKNSEPKVTLDNYERLKVGMKEAEIYRLLGHPSRRDDSLVPKVSNLGHRYEVDDKNFLQRCFWEEGDDQIWATLTGGKVKQFGATLGGVQSGDDVKAPLSLETQEKDD